MSAISIAHCRSLRPHLGDSIDLRPGRSMRRTHALVCACALVATPGVVHALEINGGVSLGGILSGITPRLAVSPHASVSWRMGSSWLFAALEIFSVLPATNGAGSFGNVPPEPQGVDDLPPPDCNIEKDTPCKEKCLKDYEDAAAVCGKMEDEAQRRSCQDAAFVVYDKCRENCAVTDKTDCKERCKKQCDKIHDRCHEDCNKNDPTMKCHARCNDEYAACLNECEKDCK